MTARAQSRGFTCVIALAITIAPSCDYAVWLSDDPDGGAVDDASPPNDASSDAPNVQDAHEPDARDIDAGGVADCELTPEPVATVRPNDALERPTFAVSGRLDTLRYGVLVPPSASAIATDDTRLVLVDHRGAFVGERTLAIVDGSGAPSSTATLHALPHASHESRATGDRDHRRERAPQEGAVRVHSIARL